MPTRGQLVPLKQVKVHHLYWRVNAFTYLLKHNKYKAMTLIMDVSTHKSTASWFNASFVSSFKKIRRTNSSTCHTWLMFRLQTTCHDSLYSRLTASSSRHSVSPSVCYIDAFVLPTCQESFACNAVFTSVYQVFWAKFSSLFHAKFTRVYIIDKGHLYMQDCQLIFRASEMQDEAEMSHR